MSDMSMSSMMDDINKYAKIWDSALAKGIFNDAPRPPVPAEPEASPCWSRAGQPRRNPFAVSEP